MSESTTEIMAGSIAGGTAKGKRKAEDGVRKSGSDTESDAESDTEIDTEREIGLAKGVEDIAAMVSQVSQDVKLVVEETRVQAGLVNRLWISMQSLKERRMRWEKLKEEHKTFMDGKAAVFAEVEQILRRQESACNEGSEVMTMGEAPIS